MSLSDQVETTAAGTWSGEPGESSAEAAGGWTADDAREYREYSLRKEVTEFVALYGWAALLTQVADVRRNGGA